MSRGFTENILKEKIMAPKWTFSKMRSRLGRLVMASVAVCCLGSLGAWADLVISVESVTADGGSTGNPLDVDLTNTGPSAVPIGGFSFGVSIANPNVSFTDANTSTAAFYIFTGNSLFGPDLTGPTSGQSLNTSDIFDIANNGLALDSGVTVGIGHILFDVLAGASPGVFAVSLAAHPFTSLSDPSGNDVGINTLSAGQITIEGAAVPEPATLGTLLISVVLMVGAAGRRRRV